MPWPPTARVNKRLSMETAGKTGLRPTAQAQDIQAQAPGPSLGCISKSRSPSVQAQDPPRPWPPSSQAQGSPSPKAQDPPGPKALPPPPPKAQDPKP